MSDPNEKDSSLPSEEGASGRDQQDTSNETIELAPAKSNWLWTFAKEWVPSILIAFALWWVLSAYVIQSVRIPSTSMLPTIEVGDRVMILKFLQFSNYEHGDIVVFYPPVKGKEETAYIKRLVGLPGDRVEVKEGKLYRNGKIADEPYVLEPIINYTQDFGVVPEGQFLFLGDNRNGSSDAHTHGEPGTDPDKWDSFFVKEEQIIGKAMFRFFPLDRFGAVERLDQ